MSKHSSNWLYLFVTVIDNKLRKTLNSLYLPIALRLHLPLFYSWWGWDPAANCTIQGPSEHIYLGCMPKIKDVLYVLFLVVYQIDKFMVLLFMPVAKRSGSYHLTWP